MINPTLFIGLGSTGLKILEHLQEMLLEHYGESSLKIFRYIAVESQEGAEVKPSEWGANDIELVRTVIGNTNAIKMAMMDSQRKYLNDWLNPKLLDIPGGVFKAGADNIRMAGRLILLENWTIVSQAIKAAYAQITGDVNRYETFNFLREHYARNGQVIDPKNPLIDQLPNVYIVGTLCGGTCSGMFLDIAFYTKHITGLYASNLLNPKVAKIIGLFTILDMDALTRTQQQGWLRNAVNCWAGMMEYDFYCHNHTRYKFTFPDNVTVDTNEAPIDTMYLVGCSATDPHNLIESNFRKATGDPDLESLSHMAATILFSETVGALLDYKSAIRTNFRSMPRSTQRNAYEHSPCFSSCGMATIWYPKYRIALASSHRYAAVICQNWMGQIKLEQADKLSKSMPKDWDAMLTEHSAKLTSNLESELDALFDEFEADSSRPPDEFRDMLRRRLQNLLQGGPYDTHIGNPGRLKDFQDRLIKTIQGKLSSFIDTESNLRLAIEWLRVLDVAIAETMRRLPHSYPTPNMGLVEDIRADLFIRLAFQREAYEGQRKKEILRDLKDYIKQHVKHIRNYHMRESLERVREELGVEMHLSEERQRAGILTLQQRMDAMMNSLERCQQKFDARHRELRQQINYTSDVRLVFQGLNTGLQDEIDTTVAQLQSAPADEQARIASRIIEPRRLSDFLGMEGRDNPDDMITKRLLQVLIREVLLKVGQFDVVNYVNTQWETNDLMGFAKHGLPHVELTGGRAKLASTTIGKSVSFVAGKGREQLNQILHGKFGGTQYERFFEDLVESSELTHMLFFYREEGLMYMDDNFATASLFEKCYQEAETILPYGLHTHKEGRIAFDPRISWRRDKVSNELMPVATRILSEQNEEGRWIQSEVFSLEDGRLVLRGALKNRLNFLLTADDGGVEDCSKEQEKFEYFQDEVMKRFDSLSNEELVDRINRRTATLETQLRRQNKDYLSAVNEERERLMGIHAVAQRFKMQSATTSAPRSTAQRESQTPLS